MKTTVLVLAALVSCQGPQPQEPTPAPQAAQEKPAVDAASTTEVREAIRRGLPFVEEQGVAWMEGRVPIQEGSPCVSCHHVGYSLWSQREAQRVGVPGNKALFETLSSDALQFMEKPGIPRAYAASSILLADIEPSATLVAALVDLQDEEGGWAAMGQFPTQRRSSEESDAAATLWSLLSLSQETTTASLEEAQNRGRAWLAKQDTGTSTEWLAANLATAHAFGDQEAAHNLENQLLDRQNENGGWGWLEEDPSEAFSTGQALYALSLPDAAGNDESSDENRRSQEAAQRAASFLVHSQGQDGSWKVLSSAISNEPSEAKDVINHFWGSAWATIGLSRSLPPA